MCLLLHPRWWLWDTYVLDSMFWLANSSKHYRRQPNQFSFFSLNCSNRLQRYLITLALLFPQSVEPKSTFDQSVSGHQHAKHKNLYSSNDMMGHWKWSFLIREQVMYIVLHNSIIIFFP
jgi:hypothetical protein